MNGVEDGVVTVRNGNTTCFFLGGGEVEEKGGGGYIFTGFFVW